jgi:3-deoxy-D-manno-octulosonate 8-phosphate phosphatase (KDO 8-P phosphatase)
MEKVPKKGEKEVNPKLFVIDVDGTLTDGRLYIGQDGEVMKAFHVHDGQGIKSLMNNGVIPVIITARESKIVQRRCEELGITELYQKTRDKRSALDMLCEKHGVTLEQMAYIGDDLNDLEAIRAVGLSFCPSNAVAEVRGAVQVVLHVGGGNGAVREAAEYILNRGKV